MEREMVTMCEAIHQAWPNVRTLAAELMYCLDEQGRVLNDMFTEHRRVALQVLVDYRAASREFRRNRLSEAAPQECMLYDNLAPFPQVEIVQEFSPCGAHSSNHQFQPKNWYPDESKRDVDFLGQIQRNWQEVGLEYWLGESEA